MARKKRKQKIKKSNLGSRRINEKHDNSPCWEYLKCGREKGGKNVDEKGICPAYPDYGRFCWTMSGTLCDKEVHGTFATKKLHCINCKFFVKVKDEEDIDFVFVNLDDDEDEE